MLQMFTHHAHKSSEPLQGVVDSRAEQTHSEQTAAGLALSPHGTMAMGAHWWVPVDTHSTMLHVDADTLNHRSQYSTQRKHDTASF